MAGVWSWPGIARGALWGPGQGWGVCPERTEAGETRAKRGSVRLGLGPVVPQRRISRAGGQKGDWRGWRENRSEREFLLEGLEFRDEAQTWMN